MLNCVLGADVGGTKIAVTAVDRNGTMLAPKLVAPSATESADAFLSGLEEALRHALVEFEEFAPVGIGLACAGTVDRVRGVMVKSPNLPLVETPVGPPLSLALNMPVVLENDAKAAMWAEHKAGAAQGCQNAVLLILGTGVGGGLLLDGKVYRGAHGAAGELGHLVVKPGGLLCGCGGRGHLEPYAAGPALARYAAERAGDPVLDADGALKALVDKGEVTGRTVSELALNGHPGALEAVHELAGWVGAGLVSITDAFDPEVIVVGGGVSGLGEVLLGPAEEYLRANAIAPGRDEVRVTLAKFGNDAGMIGAALSAWESLEDAGAERPAPLYSVMLYLCATPIGNLQDVTQRVLEVLKNADLVACEDTRHTRILLERHGINARLISFHEHNEEQRLNRLLPLLREGKDVAVVSDAGMPGVSDPGFTLVRACVAEDLPVTVLPGPSAASTALVLSGLPCDRFAFVGFLARAKKKLVAQVEDFDGTGAAVVAFESPRRVRTSLKTLGERWPGRQVAVCRELTKLHEEVLRGTAAEVLEKLGESVRGEIVVVLEPVSAQQTTSASGAKVAASRAMGELMEAGVGVKKAAGIVADLTGLSRRDLYESGLQVKK